MHHCTLKQALLYTITKLYKVYSKTDKCCWIGSGIDEQNIAEWKRDFLKKSNILYCAELSATNCRAELSAPNCPAPNCPRRIVLRRIVRTPFIEGALKASPISVNLTLWDESRGLCRAYTFAIVMGYYYSDLTIFGRQGQSFVSDDSKHERYTANSKQNKDACSLVSGKILGIA